MLENDLTIIEETSKPTTPAVTKKPAKATQKEIQERIDICSEWKNGRADELKEIAKEE